LGQKSPLFGWRSDQIRLCPLSYPEAIQMVSHYSESDRACVYFLVGGVPAYLERFTPGRSLHRAIIEEFCSELKFLALEPHFLLREELRDPTRYFAILTFLAERRMRHKELAAKMKIEARVLAVYLETLVVGLRKDNWIDLGECKWGPVRSLPSVARELDYKISLYPNKAGLSIGRHIFLKQKPRQSLADFQVHYLSRLFSDW
jgi:hypothetical protein